MYDVIKTVPIGIKCDNPNCEFCDMSVPYESYPKYVNKPCPLCGENLLTEECYAKTKRLVDMSSNLNKRLNALLPDNVLRKMGEKKKVLIMDADKNGNPKSIDTYDEE